jgi:phosphotriesterase-related protein
MTKVNTVLGVIHADQMGPTLMHEHMVLAYPGWDLDALSKHFELDELAEICAKALGEVRGYGVKTVLDATPSDLWRNVELDKAVADKTGLNIICATGMYFEAEGMPAYLKFHGQILDIVSELYDTFMHEITVGIGKSGVKAGVIKVATGHGAITPYEESVFKAAARAHRETGVPVITHTQGGTMGVEQAALLIGEGVRPDKIVIGHMCGNSDIEYQKSVLAQGVSIGFDRWGLNFIHPDNLRMETVLGLLRQGHSGNIVLSQDCNAQWMGRPVQLPDFVKPLIDDWSYTHVLKRILPQMKESGVKDEQIGQMLVENPRRIFS